MNKFIHVLQLIFEAIVAPFNVIIKSNGFGLESPRWLKPLVIFLVAIIIVAIGVLFYYREYIFNIAV